MNERQERDRTSLDSSMSLLRMVQGFWLSHALGVAVKLKVADLLKDGPKSVDELAEATGTHAPSLFRVLRALAAEGVFAEDENRRFSLTPVGSLLVAGAHGSLRAFVLEELDEEHHQAWGDLMHSVKTGGIAFGHHFGMDLWQYRATHQEDARTFDEAMAAVAAAASKPVLDAYDFSPFRRIVDVGGGNGTLLAGILHAYPATKGVLFDLPRVVPKAQQRLQSLGLAARCKIVPGDFFDSVPAGNDAYILKAVIHDWDDEHAAAILANCRRAMAQDGRLLLIEAVIPPGNGHFFHKFMDLNMLVMTGGHERTADEYAALLRSAGFKPTRTFPTSFELSVIEAAPG